MTMKKLLTLFILTTISMNLLAAIQPAHSDEAKKEPTLEETATWLTSHGTFKTPADQAGTRSVYELVYSKDTCTITQTENLWSKIERSLTYTQTHPPEEPILARVTIRTFPLKKCSPGGASAQGSLVIVPTYDGKKLIHESTKYNDEWLRAYKEWHFADDERDEESDSDFGYIFFVDASIADRAEPAVNHIIKLAAEQKTTNPNNEPF